MARRVNAYTCYVTKTVHWARSSSSARCACGEPTAVEHIDGHRVELGKLHTAAAAAVTCSTCKEIMRDVWEIAHTPAKSKAPPPAAKKTPGRGRPSDRRPRR
jgi:hypothetical protein